MTLVSDDSLDPQPAPSAGGWLSRGVWAVADQGFFATSNFVLNVLLARWLSPADYGAFVTAFFIFLLLATAHNGLLIEPMLVFGPSNFRDRTAVYRSGMLQLHLWFSIPLAALLAIGAFVAHAFGAPALATALGALALAGPAILFLWLMRRVCYLHSAPHRAAIAGMAYMVAMLAAMFTLRHFQALSIATALGIQGAASLLAALALTLSERVAWPKSRDQELLSQVRQQHFRYSRWASASGLVGFIPGQVYYLLLPILVSTEASGVLRGLTNLVMPLLQATWALAMLLLPRLSRLRGTPEFHKTATRAMTLIVAGAVVYWIAIGIFHAPLIHLLYGHADPAKGEARLFGQFSWLLWFIGFQPVLQGINSIFGAVVIADQRPDRYFYAQVAASAAALTLGAFLAYRFGIVGAAIAILVNQTVQAAVLTHFARKTVAVPADDASMRPLAPAVRP